MLDGQLGQSTAYQSIPTGPTKAPWKDNTCPAPKLFLTSHEASFKSVPLKHRSLTTFHQHASIRYLLSRAQLGCLQASKERMASFQKVIERSHSQVTSLKASVNNIFQAVSAHRFRDVAPDIRTLVIEGIAHWTSSLPADFLQDQYLKYVAWALSDRVCHLLGSLA